LKVYVAGHNGMVGSSIVRNSPMGVDLVTTNRDCLDLRDEKSVEKFFMEQGLDAVIIAAAKVGGIGINSSDNSTFLIDNLKIQNAVIGSAVKAGIPNLIFLGSSCVYPKFSPQPIKEEALLSGPLEPTNEGYALSKIAGIRLCNFLHHEMGLNYFSLMPSNLYGMNDNYDLKSAHVPAALMRRLHSAKINDSREVVVWGTGTPRREFLHVDDLARACWQMLSRQMGGKVINVGTGTDLTISDFAILMAGIVGYQGKIVFDSTKPDGTPRKLLDISLINSLGWKHEMELETGLRQTYQWFVEALSDGKVRGY